MSAGHIPVVVGGGVMRVVVIRVIRVDVNHFCFLIGNASDGVIIK